MFFVINKLKMIIEVLFNCLKELDVMILFFIWVEKLIYKEYKIYGICMEFEEFYVFVVILIIGGWIYFFIGFIGDGYKIVKWVGYMVMFLYVIEFFLILDELYI